MTDWSDLPGAEHVDRGLRDAASSIESVPALLVAIGAPRLRRLGLPLPPDSDLPTDPELRLYRRLRAEGSGDSFSRYNALLRELVSFERALEHRCESERRRRIAGG